ncbi:MAG: hypothetical protein B7Y42_00540 [Polaromonas sp. 28-63-22]|jgi:hypothetical protein|nr:MAG: hypothetical protein B7Y42_00540 [Polaromonas sp. 28-63-22]
MERIFVKPAAPDLKVRKPVNGYLAADGEMVNAESYWLRRIADGDVVGAEAPADTPKTAVATALQPRTKSA